MLFESKEKAENFIKFNGEEMVKQSGKSPSRSYYCRFCMGWHVTSMDSAEEGEQIDQMEEERFNLLIKKRLESKANTSVPNIDKSVEKQLSTRFNLTLLEADQYINMLEFKEADESLSVCEGIADNAALSLQKADTMKSKCEHRREIISSLQRMMEGEFCESDASAAADTLYRTSAQNMELIREYESVYAEMVYLAHKTDPGYNRLKLVLKEMATQFKGVSKVQLMRIYQQKAEDVDELYNASSKVKRDMLRTVIDKLETFDLCYSYGELDECEKILEVSSALLDSLEFEPDEYVIYLRGFIEKRRLKLG